MSNLIFITHPSVDVDPSTPASMWRISENGRNEIKTLLELEFWKDVKSIYTSPEPKASEVAKIAGEKFSIPFAEIRDLREIERDGSGFLEPEKYKYAVEEFYIHPTDSYKGWETAHDATTRIQKAVQEIMSEHSDETIAIVGHGIIGTCLACSVKGIDPSFNEDPRISGCYIMMDFEDKKILSDWQKY